MSWLGLTPEESLALWRPHDWQRKCYETLVEVASSEDAPYALRFQALQTLNTFVEEGVLSEPGDKYGTAAFICKTLAAMTRPSKPLSKRALRRAAMRAGILDERLAAARAILHAIHNVAASEKSKPGSTQAVGFGPSGLGSDERLLS